MTDQMLFGAIFGVLTVCAMYFAYTSYRLIKYHVIRRRMRTEGANVIKADLDKSPKCYHTWDDITLGMLSLPVGKYKVCTTCGFVCGTEMKLNAPAMEAMKEGIAKRAAVKKEQEYLAQRLEDDIIRRRDIWIDQNLDKFIAVIRPSGEFNPGLNPSMYYKELLTSFGVYMRKEYQKSVEKIYEEEKARR